VLTRGGTGGTVNQQSTLIFHFVGTLLISIDGESKGSWDQVCGLPWGPCAILARSLLSLLICFSLSLWLIAFDACGSPLSDQIFAQQLCLLMFERYRRVTAAEFVGQAFGGKDRESVTLQQ